MRGLFVFALAFCTVASAEIETGFETPELWEKEYEEHKRQQQENEAILSQAISRSDFHEVRCLFQRGLVPNENDLKTALKHDDIRIILPILMHPRLPREGFSEWRAICEAFGRNNMQLLQSLRDIVEREPQDLTSQSEPVKYLLALQTIKPQDWDVECWGMRRHIHENTGH